jgi:hypothetical protein
MGTHSDRGHTQYDRYVQSWGEDAQKIKVGGYDTEYDDIIAPLFKIQSTYGAAVWEAYFDVAQKRCATYQEAGYPAGRWRLPTLAEIAFIVKLQNENVIEDMFNKNSTGYWTSSGGKIVADETMTYTSKYGGYGDTSSKCYVRCVYDLWYWQDGDNDAHQTLPTHQYHPKPTFD